MFSVLRAPRSLRLAASFLPFAAAAASVAEGAGQSGRSSWVYPDAQGRLVYAQTAAGDRIADFSSAGYGGGGVSLPTVAVASTVAPSGADDTAALQAALDAVAKRDPVNGFRGAVQLAPGTFTCSQTLTIGASGVVLRGSGSGPGGTEIRMAGRPHGCIAVSAREEGRRGDQEPKQSGRTARIVDAYVPSGAASFDVDSADGFAVGDAVLILRPSTPEWVRFMGMADLVRDGKKEHWVSVPGVIRAERAIAAIAGHRITLDAPLTDSLDARFLAPTGAGMVRYAVPGRLAQIGIESLAIVSAPQAVTITAAHNSGIRLSGVEDAWVRDVAMTDTVNSVGMGGGTRRITLTRVRIGHSKPTVGAALPADFSLDGSQLLLDRCAATGSRVFYVATGAEVTGPNVVLNCVFHGEGRLQPHQRWATGLLVDGCRVPEGGIDFRNRGQMGTGHGWTMGWAVAWNCEAKSFVIQKPPGATNWAIGCVGSQELAAQPFGKSPMLPQGIIDSPGRPVLPASLYLAQLRERLGPQAVKNIGY